MYLKLIFKSPIFVPFAMNLVQLLPNLTAPVWPRSNIFLNNPDFYLSNDFIWQKSFKTLSVSPTFPLQLRYCSVIVTSLPLPPVTVSWTLRSSTFCLCATTRRYWTLYRASYRTWSPARTHHSSNSSSPIYRVSTSTFTGSVVIDHKSI